MSGPVPLPPRPLPALARQLPWWARAGVGLLALGLGLYLIGRPLSTLSVLAVYVGISCIVVGVGEVAREEQTRVSVLLGIGWGLLGLVVLVTPGHAIGALPEVLAIVLLVSGVLHLLRVRSGTVDERLAAGLFGLTEMVLGGLALAWQDVTLIVVAALFGIRVVVLGVSLLVEALVRRDRPRTREPRTRGPIRRWGRVLTAAVALVLSLGTLGFSDNLRDGAPEIDDFYDIPAGVGDEAGVLLRSEPFTREVPDTAKAWRILYTTTDVFGSPTVASGLVVVPVKAATKRPVIAWAHGTTGYAQHCAPSLLPEPFTAGALPALDEVIDRGWAVVASDYAGLGVEGVQPYLIGGGEARSVLDAVRASRALKAADVGPKTVLWGHSQGGGAALWADQLQPTYAPDVPLSGTVAMAPAADVVSLAQNLGSITGGSVFGSFVLEAYAKTYDDVRLADVVRPAAVSLVRRLSDRCLSEPGVLASVLTALSLGKDKDILKGDPGTGALGARLNENIPTDPGPGPLLIAQGLADTLVIPKVQEEYVDRLRLSGHQVDYRTYPGLDHMELVEDGSPLIEQLLSWTAARF